MGFLSANPKNIVSHKKISTQSIKLYLGCLLNCTFKCNLLFKNVLKCELYQHKIALDRSNDDIK